MIRAAVCDEELKINNVISDIIREFFANKNEPLELHTFLSSDNLFDECTNKSFDIVFMEIDMPGMTGFEFASKIRSYDKEIEIVFISEREDLVFESIKYSPFRFIKKSKIDDLQEAMDTYLKNKRRNEASVDFVTIHGTVTKKLMDIRYIEVYGHELVVHLRDNSIQAKGALNTLEKEIGDQGFIRIHNSFLVNSMYIFALSSRDVTLDDFTKLSVSRYRADTIKSKLQMFTR